MRYVRTTAAAALVVLTGCSGEVLVGDVSPLCEASPLMLPSTDFVDVGGTLATDGTRLYVAAIRSEDHSIRVHVIDIASFVESSSFKVPPFSNPWITVSAGDGWVFLGCPAVNNKIVYRFGPSGEQELGPVDNPGSSSGAWDDGAKRLHFARWYLSGPAGLVTTDEDVKVLAVQDEPALHSPGAISINDKANRMAVTDARPADKSAVVVLELATQQLVGEIVGDPTSPPPAGFFGVWVNDVGHVWALDIDGRLMEFDANGAWLRSIHGMTRPTAVTGDEQSGCIFVADRAQAAYPTTSFIRRFCPCP